MKVWVRSTTDFPSLQCPQSDIPQATFPGGRVGWNDRSRFPSMAASFLFPTFCHQGTPTGIMNLVNQPEFCSEDLQNEGDNLGKPSVKVCPLEISRGGDTIAGRGS